MPNDDSDDEYMEDYESEPESMDDNEKDLSKMSRESVRELLIKDLTSTERCKGTFQIKKTSLRSLLLYFIKDLQKAVHSFPTRRSSI